MASFGSYVAPVLVATATATIVALLAERHFAHGRGWLHRGFLDGAAIGSAAAIYFLALTKNPSSAIDPAIVDLAPGLRADQIPTTPERALSLVPFGEIGDLLSNSVSASVPLSQIGGNAVLFLPLTLALTARLRLPVARGVLVGIASVVLIEVLQFALGLGRVSSVDDVIVATPGIVLGAVLGRLLGRQRNSSSGPTRIRT
ncbi:VanZ family protein [Cellulosimicrobium sp. TH-20]|uniref:VanZ family protein n=1 Tax=Cellulosimicrobium sp. TH-20 TaxID=1980001 RepID=UPI0012FB4350|nr:VanZ family protein [Cellulosimicrobium sp. TH-20]